MKKGLLITLGVIAVLFLALLLIPVLFKDQIKEKIDKEIASSINAQVIYDPSGIDISIIRNFPNLTISIDNFALIGKVKEFKGDTLYAAKSTKLVADIMSVISGDKIKIKGLYLDHPLIVTKFTKDGKMSWDIAVPSADTTKVEPSEPTQFNIGIDEWEIKEGRIIYEDASMPMYAELKNVNHTGKGDVTEEVFIMDTYTQCPEVIVLFDGVKYLNRNTLEASIKMDMNYSKMIFKFLDNEFKINNFAMGFDGTLAMPGDDINFDVTYKAKETDFKNLLSLVPAIYTKDYEDIKTEGKIAFDGWVKGTMNDSLMPGYGLNLLVNNAMFQYPDLPAAVKNIGIDLHVKNQDGVTENIVVDLKKLHMELGTNPVDAKLLLEGLNPSKINADVIATLNLEDVTKIYPLDSITLKGIYNINVKANGIYSEKSLPQVNAVMALKNGYVKTAQVPESLNDVSFNATVLNTDGSLASTKVNLESFNMKFQNEPFFMKAYVENLDDPRYDVILKGILDLTKLTKIYPLEGMTLAGRINADIATKGVMSDVTAGNYGKTSTSGSMQMSNFTYSAPDFPQGMKLSTASFAFNPDKAVINSMKGSVGKSDIDIDGYVSNYMGYMFGAADSTIRGKMNFRSNTFDVNEWMTEEEPATASAPATADTGVVVVPRNIDFVLASSINKVLYTNMTLDNLKGDIIVKDGIVKMSQLGFNTLGGSIVTNGTYNTQDEKKPKFDMDLDIKEVKVKDAYSTFNSLQALAPVAKNIEGNFSTKMTIAGDLDNAMSPVMNTLFGKGALSLASASLTGNSVLSGIQNVTKTNNLLPMSLKDILIQFEIKDGKVFVKPFDVNAGNTKMKVQGNQSVTGDLDYLVNLDVPTGVVGSQVNGALASISGKPAGNNSNVKFDLKVLGTYDKPKITLAGSSVKEQATDAVKDAVTNRVKDELKNNEQIKKAQAEAEARLKAEQDRLKREAEEKIKKEAEQRLKDEAARQAQQQAEKAAKDLLKKNNPFKK
jgi:hypothetical protein